MLLKSNKPMRRLPAMPKRGVVDPAVDELDVEGEGEGEELPEEEALPPVEGEPVEPPAEGPVEEEPVEPPVEEEPVEEVPPEEEPLPGAKPPMLMKKKAIRRRVPDIVDRYLMKG